MPLIVSHQKTNKTYTHSVFVIIIFNAECTAKAQRPTSVWHGCICKAVYTHVSCVIWGLRWTQTKNTNIMQKLLANVKLYQLQMRQLKVKRQKLSVSL